MSSRTAVALDAAAAAAESAAADDDPTTQAMMLHLQQVLLLKSDPISLLNSFEGDDYLEQLAPVVEDAVNANQVDVLIDRLGKITAQKEGEVQELCNSNQQDYTKAVHQLAKVRQSSELMRASVLGINQSLQQSGQTLVAKNKMLSDLQGARNNVREATVALRQCLKVLNMTNKIHELIEQKKYFHALKSLDDLQKNHLYEVSHFEFAQRLRTSVPAMQDRIRQSVLTDLNNWLADMRAVAPEIGKIAFSATEARRRHWKHIVDQNPQYRSYKLNSAVELAIDDGDDFDPLDNEHMHVDLSPFYECAHVYSTIGALDEFRENYALDRVKDQDTILPPYIDFTDNDITPLESLLHRACGFAMIERATVRTAYHVRTATEVEELWQSMCQRIAHLIEPVLPTLKKPDTLLRVRTLLGLFIQTMESHEFSVKRLSSFMLTLFEKYSQFLKQRFTKEFQETVTQDDYMPMVINKRDLFEKIIAISWYKTDIDPAKMVLPCQLPFSQVYPLSCAEIRNFVDQHYSFSDEYTEQSPGQIEATLRNSLDQLLVDVVCFTLLSRLKSSNREEIVQIFINLEYFENAAVALQQQLNETSTVHLSEPIQLRAVSQFASARKQAEQRIFELINSKIDDFLEIAEYDWETSSEGSTPSSYLIDMVNFLETLVNSTLVNLPKSIKSFIYFDAFDHLSTSMLDLLQNAGRRISRPALVNFDRDVQYLEAFVSNLGNSGSNQSGSSVPTVLRPRSTDNLMDNSILMTFTELRQTIDLLLSTNMEEYNNAEVRMRKYGRVRPQVVASLVEKYVARVLCH
ncbi:exocyst complex subunit Sec15-like-domain-containing protein [Limtongia smithiae]|uniref:exocyst complex subunit Sec15-like-domain-containing protein n=1 Tax=Limtongia smithiae TaxID=1125753 RepID=UPI0034CE5905